MFTFVCAKSLSVPHGTSVVPGDRIVRIVAAMPDHAAAFLEVCRVGGGRFALQKRSTKHRVGYFNGSLRACFGIFGGRERGRHAPLSFCTKCHRVVLKCQQANAAGRDDFATCGGGGCGEAIANWRPQSRTSCAFCSELE